MLFVVKRAKVGVSDVDELRALLVVYKIKSLGVAVGCDTGATIFPPS